MGAMTVYGSDGSFGGHPPVELSVVRETAKAYLLSADGNQQWVPKRVIALWEDGSDWAAKILDEKFFPKPTPEQLRVRMEIVGSVIDQIIAEKYPPRDEGEDEEETW